MMKIRKIFMLLMPLTLAAPSLTASTVEKIVATVNGEAITSSDLDQGVTLLGPAVTKETKAGGTALRAKVLDKIIDNIIMRQSMKDAEKKFPEMVNVKPFEVDQYIENMLRASGLNMAAFEEKLKERGMTVEKYRDDLHQQILQDKFLQSQIGRKVVISERELRDYFEKNMDEFKSVTSVQLTQMFIPFTGETSADTMNKMETLALQINEEAKTNSDFEAIAKKYSGKPLVVYGGNLGVVNLSDLQPQIAQVAAQLEIGQTSGPILSNTGVHIIKVLDRSKTSAKDFASVRDRVQEAVYQIKLHIALDDYTKAKRREAHIEIKGL